MKPLSSYVGQVVNDANFRLDVDTEPFIKYLMTNCFIVKNSVGLTPPFIKDDIAHGEMIDQVVMFLLKEKLFNNVLTYGYSMGRDSTVSKHLHCISTNHCVSRLKDHAWKSLHITLGSRSFANLLVNYTILEYQFDCFNQLTGNVTNRPHLPPQWYLNKEEKTHSSGQLDKISNNLFLHKVYRNHSMAGANKMTREVSILQDILLKNAGHRKSTTRDKIQRCIAKMTNMCRKKMNFQVILNNMCPVVSAKSASNHLDRQNDIRDVTKFVIFVIEKIVPQDMYGSKKNKSLIFAKVSEFLELPLGGSLFIEDISKGIQLKKCTWLGYDKCGASNDQFADSMELLEKFLLWYFKLLVPNIMVFFFYCTEVSSTTSVIYFRRDVWMDMVTPFRESYFSEHLVENPICRNHASYALSSFNHSRFRIVPKKADKQFRVISVPNKGVDEAENKLYYQNKRNVIMPVQEILSHLRSKRPTNFQKLNSTMQITGAIQEFKIGLLEKYKTLPVLHFMKFDIASCYDSIPRNKVIRVIRRLLEKDDGYLVRVTSRYNPRSGKMSTFEVINGKGTENMHSMIVDKARTRYFSAEDIIGVLESELFKTVIWDNDKCYLRKDGLFQGSSLSGLIVDILYDDLLEHYSEFKRMDNTESIILRLADDFLIVSTDANTISQVQKLAYSGFLEYNAKVNVDKIIVENSQVSSERSLQFCGLDICLMSLEVWKDISSLNTPKLSSLSTKSLFMRLEWLLNLRLDFKTINRDINSWDVILDQIRFISENISCIMTLSFRKRTLNADTFQTFLGHVNRCFLERCLSQYLELSQELQLRLTVASIFLKQFQKYSSNYVDVIRFLKEETDACKFMIELCI